MKTELFIIIFGYICTVLFGYSLKIMNIKYLKKYGKDIPPEFAGYIDQGLLTKTCDYTIENSRFSFLESIINNCILLAFLFAGLLNAYNLWIMSLDLHFIFSGLAFFLILVYAENVLSAPFSIYSTFKIENKYGFNTMTPKLWIADFFKSILLSTILSGILIAVGLWLVSESPGHWWLWVWMFFLIFSLFIMYISPYVIEPLFNKFSPVEDQVLEDKIKELSMKAGIKVSRIFRMDASKRSSHTNAYFTGIGKVKRIILYDTLLEKMNSDEIIAVLAHEMGHWKKKHVLKLIVMSEALAFAGLFIAHKILQTNYLSELFSIEQSSFFAKAVVLGFIGSIALFPLTPLFAYISRRHERQADRFACELTRSPEGLATSLIKLSKDNLSNLHPHPFYAAFYYSHPPVLQRVRWIRSICNK
ncbi:MAG: M48 family metallopeptidase [Nitrospirae bacterium]|nr:M48 family metallopeptidase [Nitrospirota bacterium]